MSDVPRSDARSIAEIRERLDTQERQHVLTGKGSAPHVEALQMARTLLSALDTKTADSDSWRRVAERIQRDLASAEDQSSALAAQVASLQAQLARVSALPEQWRQEADEECRERMGGWTGADAKLRSCADELSEALVSVSRPDRTPDDVLAHGRETAEAMGLDVVPIGGPVRKKRKGDPRPPSPPKEGA